MVLMIFVLLRSLVCKTHVIDDGRQHRAGLNTSGGRGGGGGGGGGDGGVTVCLVHNRANPRPLANDACQINDDIHRRSPSPAHYLMMFNGVGEHYRPQIYYAS